MAINPSDAANAKGCIDSVMSFTKTKLLPHVPEMTIIRFTRSVESGTFPMRLPQINVGCFDGKGHSAWAWRVNEVDDRDPGCMAAPEGIPPPIDRDLLRRRRPAVSGLIVMAFKIGVARQHSRTSTGGSRLVRDCSGAFDAERAAGAARLCSLPPVRAATRQTR